MTVRTAGVVMPPSVRPAASPAAAPPSVDPYVAEFRPEAHAMPSFFVWTIGCQMNQSDSEEMAGQLLAAGCARASAMELADLIVINTCAVREHAEAKVIGRQGQLAELKRARPGLRVVLAGCGVRESERAGLPKRFPAVDLFLRPDEEPELALRLGLVSAQAPIGLRTAATAATTVVSATRPAPIASSRSRVGPSAVVPSTTSSPRRGRSRRRGIGS